MKEKSRALTPVAIWTGAALVLLVASGSVWLLLANFGSGSSQDNSRLDAIRTAASIVVGTGGAAALLLAARRQRSAELDLEQKERGAADTRHDMAERRITELYTKSAEQLGSDKAPVRLAGLYALERLAQDAPNQRQTVVNVFCAYLRMPEPIDGQTNEEAMKTEEYQVRMAAQRILIAHLDTADDTKFWPDTDLDFTGATLRDWHLNARTVRRMICTRTKFVGPARFQGTRFTGTAGFYYASFGTHAFFQGAKFEEGARFGGTEFACCAQFEDATVRTDVEARRIWPGGWVLEPAVDGWATLVPNPYLRRNREAPRLRASSRA
ncbi:pentapeptide repeat-containing protein [Amycolatopsis sp.]|uniref:pentapeptide repeat-containing protein n=1 Tax=Amycolatopsis sp. TaxID=37632 RepID=UPI002DFBF3F0|nr:pentapeptide repeat-containing protein [Amycolatopsis sp.]